MLDELKRKDLPSFIRDNAVFNGMNKIDKVFPKIGLVNTEETIDGSTKPIEKAAVVAVRKLASTLSLRAKRLKKLGDTKIKYGLYRNENGRRRYTKVVPRPKDWINRRNSVVAVMEQLSNRMKWNPKAFVKTTKSETKLVLTKGSLTSKIGKINKQLKKIREAKVPLPTKALKNELKGKTVVFSSDGAKGVWDIATMSMRGIRSCQGWGSSHSSCLVGTIADPFAGIIYVTSGNRMSKGSKMHYRSVVRLVDNNLTHKPTFLIERVYPCGLSPDKVSQAVELFKTFIRKHSNTNYPIVYSGDSDIDRIAIEYSIPATLVTSRAANDGYSSYRDSRVQYKQLPAGNEISKLLR
jgi:hypothetical protein